MHKNEVKLRELKNMDWRYNDFAGRYSEVSAINGLDEEMLFKVYYQGIIVAGDKPFDGFT